MEVGPFCRSAPVRIDDDEASATLSGPLDDVPCVNARADEIDPPRQDQSGVFDVLRIRPRGADEPCETLVLAAADRSLESRRPDAVEERMNESTAPLASPERYFAISGANTSKPAVSSVVFGGSRSASE